MYWCSSLKCFLLRNWTSNCAATNEVCRELFDRNGRNLRDGLDKGPVSPPVTAEYVAAHLTEN